MRTAIEPSPTPTAIWSRILDPDRQDYTREAARAVLELDFDPADHRRIVELSAKTDDGTLTAVEREELETLVEINDVLMLLKAKARLSLKKAGQVLAHA